MDVRCRTQVPCTQVRLVASGLERGRDIARMLHVDNMLVAVEGEEEGSEMNSVLVCCVDSRHYEQYIAARPVRNI